MKTNYHKKLGILYLVLVFAAVVSLVYYYQTSKGPWYNFPSNSDKQRAYTNSEYKFKFNYPTTYELNTTEVGANYFKSAGKGLVRVELPKDYFPDTNFGSANIVFAVKDASSADDCQNYLTSANRTTKMTDYESVNGEPFYTDNLVGAAAGTKYETRIYRTLKNHICYEANLTVGVSNIGNYEPGAVAEVDEVEIWKRLFDVLDTLKIN